MSAPDPQADSVQWSEEAVATRDFRFSAIAVHTANSSAKIRMQRGGTSDWV